MTPVRWYELIVDSPMLASEVISTMLREYAPGLVVEDTRAGRRLRSYLPETEALTATVEAIESRLANLPAELLQDGSPQTSHAWVEEEDWAEAWKAYFRPMRVGRRMVIKPTWYPWPPDEQPELARADDVVLELDPGMAFGTGAHPTTRLCLAAVEHHVKPGDQVVDLGCGSGVLSAAALKLGASSVLAIDTDPLAVEATEANCLRNDVEGCEVVLQAGLAATCGAWDLIVANISAMVIKAEAPLAAQRLRPGGVFVCSGFFEGYTDEICDLLRSCGLEILAECSEEQWACIHSRKP